MSIVIMNMSQGNIEQDGPVTGGYDDEVMCSGWNPALAMTQLVPDGRQRSFPAELATVDMALFLQKMYG